MTVSGSLLPDTAAETASDTEPLTAFAALIAFQQMRHESRLRCLQESPTSICATSCRTTAAAAMTLVPARGSIVTDISWPNYYVNCIIRRRHPGHEHRPIIMRGFLENLRKRLSVKGLHFTAAICYTVMRMSK